MSSLVSSLRARAFRLPLRVRLIATFALVVGAAFLVIGVVTIAEVRADLDRTIDSSLSSRLSDLEALARNGATQDRLLRLPRPSGSMLQVLGPGGEVRASTSPPGRRPLLTGDRRRRALRGSTSGEVSGPDGPLRVRTTTMGRGSNATILVAARPLDERNRSLRTLVLVLLAGGTLALVLACLAGYRVLRTALESVERMRRQAATVSAADPGRRLPLPGAEDELHALGTTLNEMLEGLEESASRERRFLAEASHELRTPLAVLHMELELALRGDRSPEELRRALSEALGDTERLTRLAEDLLVLARADDGRAPLSRRSVEAHRSLADSAQRMAPAVPAGRAVRVEGGVGVMVFADPDRLGRALDNLLDNALRHGAGDVTLAAGEQDGEVVLSVADSGRGFGEEIVDVAFERFTQSRRSRSGGGNGLGLAVVRSVAEAHEGSTGARNRPGGGAEVWIRLPRA